MKNCFRFTLLLFLGLTFNLAARAEHHHATHLGNPATRFAPTLYSPDDLRARFNDPKLHSDFIAILRQYGWPGNFADFFAAGQTNPIEAIEIPVGTVMPFMSSRENGRPVCLRNVTWAGKEPIHAYAFTFISNGRIYRCITPKPCSNFFVVDIGPAPEFALAVDCDVPDKVILGRKMEACITVHNIGNVTESNAVVTLPIPQDAQAIATTDGGIVTNGVLQWEIPDLTAGSTKTVCAKFNADKPAKLNFNPTVRSDDVAPVNSSCATEVAGISAILLEKADDPDPVAIGDTTTYTVKVTNQGTAADSNVKVVVTIAPELTPVSSSEGTIDGQIVTLPTVPTLAPKQIVTYTIVAKGVKAGDGHTRFDLSSDILKSSIYAEESTTVY